MEKIKLICSRCGVKVNGKPHLAGATKECPKCGQLAIFKKVADPSAQRVKMNTKQRSVNRNQDPVFITNEEIDILKRRTSYQRYIFISWGLILQIFFVGLLQFIPVLGVFLGLLTLFAFLAGCILAWIYIIKLLYTLRKPFWYYLIFVASIFVPFGPLIMLSLSFSETTRHLEAVGLQLSWTEKSFGLNGSVFESRIEKLINENKLVLQQ